MASQPGAEVVETELPSRGHAQGLQELAVAQEAGLLRRIVVAVRAMQRLRRSSQVRGQRDIQDAPRHFPQPRQGDRRLARAGRADDHQRGLVTRGGFLGVVEDQRPLQQLEADTSRGTPVQEGGIGVRPGREHRVDGNRALDPGFVDLRAAQEARALVDVVLDHLERQADRLRRLAVGRRQLRELQQQAGRVVQLRAVAGADMELLDIGGAEVVALDGGAHLLEGGSDAAEVEILVLQQTHRQSDGGR